MKWAIILCYKIILLILSDIWCNNLNNLFSRKEIQILCKYNIKKNKNYNVIINYAYPNIQNLNEMKVSNLIKMKVVRISSIYVLNI